MFDIGLPTCGKPISKQLFQLYKDAGIKFMEATCKPYTLNYELTKSLAEKYGRTLSAIPKPIHYRQVNQPCNSILGLRLTVPSFSRLDISIGFAKTVIQS